jgi:hypothetical protein
VVTFYVRCLIDDEGRHGPDNVGYRIFLKPKIVVSENCVHLYCVFILIDLFLLLVEIVVGSQGWIQCQQYQ